MKPVDQANMCMSLSVFLFPNILNDMWFLRSKSQLRNMLEDELSREPYKLDISLTSGMWNDIRRNK